MNLPQVPPPEQVLQKIEPVTTALYEMFPTAAQQALPYFRARGLELNGALIVCMLRYEVKQQLLKAEFQVEDDDPDGAEPADLLVEHLANNGLACTFNGVSIKVLKSDDGRLPVPGPSRRRQSFYAQQLGFIGEGFGPSGNSEPERQQTSTCLNVVILWHFDPSYTVLGLRLAAPKAGSLSRASVAEYWNVAIEHPAIVRGSTPMVKGDENLVEPEVTEKEEEPIRDQNKETHEEQ